MTRKVIWNIRCQVLMCTEEDLNTMGVNDDNEKMNTYMVGPVICSASQYGKAYKQYSLGSLKRMQ